MDGDESHLVSRFTGILKPGDSTHVAFASLWILLPLPGVCKSQHPKSPFELASLTYLSRRFEHATPNNPTI